MNIDDYLNRLSEKVHPGIVCGIGLVMLVAGYALHDQLGKRLVQLQNNLRALTEARQQSDAAANHYQTLAELKTQDVDKFKENLSTLAQSKKTLFEAGLSSQEERRLLEKQWEIITTYLTIHVPLQRVFLMRGDQPLESYLMQYVPLKACGGAPATVPRVVRIVSKERFANPERGKSELINGKLQWEPPQVGTSVRSNALGEYVMFTNSKLILHGPPKNEVDHEAFPHLCLGLSKEAARNLYHHSFIGTKILLSNVREELERQAAFTVTVDTTPREMHGN